MRQIGNIRVGQLWVQQLAEDGDLQYKKVKGESTPTDLCTKHLTRLRIDYLIALTLLSDRAGIAQEGLHT